MGCAALAGGRVGGVVSIGGVMVCRSVITAVEPFRPVPIDELAVGIPWAGRRCRRR
ncbi:MAG: hypothetical protein ABSG86_32080 [Thermoguttaceae bacterium]|jgi:hypothetical protein